MEIDRIGVTERYTIYKRNVVKTKPQAQLAAQDTINLTKAALQNADMLRVRNIAMSAPDLRVDRLSQLRQKLQDANYPDNSIITGTADRLLDHWEL